MFAIRIPFVQDWYAIEDVCLSRWSWVTLDGARIALGFGSIILAVVGLLSTRWEVVVVCLVIAVGLFMMAILLTLCDLGPEDYPKLPSTSEGDRLPPVGKTSLRQSSSTAKPILCSTSSGKQPLEQHEEHSDCSIESPHLQIPSRLGSRQFRFMSANERAASSRSVTFCDGVSTSYGTAGEQDLPETEAKAQQDTNTSRLRRSLSVGDAEIQPLFADVEDHKEHSYRSW